MISVIQNRGYAVKETREGRDCLIQTLSLKAGKDEITELERREKIGKEKNRL